jgi:hypothetical protein
MTKKKTLLKPKLPPRRIILGRFALIVMIAREQDLVEVAIVGRVMVEGFYP